MSQMYTNEQRLEIYKAALKRIQLKTVNYIVYAIWYSVDHDSLDEFENDLEINFPELKGKHLHDGNTEEAWNARVELMNECINEVLKLMN